VENEFTNAWDELITLEDRIVLLNTHRDAMEAVVAAYHEQFELGKRPLINLLDVENELFAARSTVDEERFNRLQAAYRLLASTGDLISVLQ
jgi:adhesin transport system outer membrane protein